MALLGTPHRIVIRAIVFLLLGAIVNIAVAWGCACRTETDDGSAADIDTWLRPVPRDWPPRPDYGWNFAGLGLYVMIVDGHGPEPDGHWVGDKYVGPWSPALYRFVWFRSGLPLQSMHWCVYDMMPEARGTLDHWPDRTHSLIESGLNPVPSLLHEWQWKFQRRLPVAILWPGFAINTIFYAAILWLLFAGPGMLRRRRRRLKRGLCPHCAYDLRGIDSPRCPECGAPISLSFRERAGVRGLPN